MSKVLYLSLHELQTVKEALRLYGASPEELADMTHVRTGADRAIAKSLVGYVEQVAAGPDVCAEAQELLRQLWPGAI